MRPCHVISQAYLPSLLSIEAVASLCWPEEGPAGDLGECSPTDETSCISKVAAKLISDAAAACEIRSDLKPSIDADC